MKLNNFNMIASSVAALGGLGIAVYQLLGPGAAPDKAQPVQVTVSVDQNGNATTTTKQAATANAAQMTDAGKLLNTMRASLGLVADSYAAEVGKPGAHQSGRLVLASTNETATALNELDKSIKSKDAKQISASSKKATRSIGKLQTNYALAATKPERAEVGMKTLNNNWNAYAARYMVQTDRKIAQNAAETKKLKKRVSELEARVAGLEDRTRENEALNREVVRVRERLTHDEYDYDDEEEYAGLMITLAFIDGAFEALSISSQHYYPEYYDDLRYDPDAYDLADAYWDGYYDGYYDGRDEAWYEEDYAVPQVVVLHPDPIIIQYQEINYTQIINVTKEAEVAYEALPAETLTTAKIEPVAEEAISTSQAIQTIARAEPAAAEPAPAMDAEAEAGEQPAADTAATEPEAAPKGDLSATEEPVIEPSTEAEAPAQEQPAIEQPASDAATADPPAVEEPAATEAGGGQTATETQAEQPAVEEPAAATEEQASEQPAQPTEETATTTPPEETAAPAEEPAAEAPAEETAAPSEEQPTEQPVEETAAPAEEPAAEAPAEETAAPSEEQPTEQPAEEQGATEQPAQEEAVTEQQQ